MFRHPIPVDRIVFNPFTTTFYEAITAALDAAGYEPERKSSVSEFYIVVQNNNPAGAGDRDYSLVRPGPTDVAGAPALPTTHSSFIIARATVSDPLGPYQWPTPAFHILALEDHGANCMVDIVVTGPFVQPKGS